jgi:hypothetical protein
MSGCQRKEATTKAPAKPGRRSASSALAMEDASAEVAAAVEAAANAGAEERPEPPAKTAPRRARPRPSPAPVPTSKPTHRQKTLKAAKEKEIFKALNESVKKLQEQLNQSEK